MHDGHGKVSEDKREAPSRASKRKGEMIEFVAQNWHSLMWSAIVLGAAIVIALIVHYVVFQVSVAWLPDFNGPVPRPANGSTELSAHG